MEGIEGILGALNMSEEDMMNIAQSAQSNPLAAMESLQQFLTPEIMESVMDVMSNDPEGMKQAAEQFGISSDEIDKITEQLNGE